MANIPFILFSVVFSVSLSCNNCLVRNNTRITGGNISVRSSRPFQVALYSRVGTTGEIGFCGGSLVHPEWVLTAAHCCFHDGVQVDNVQAILGAYSLYDRYENGRRIVNVDEIVLHSDWDSETFANDLALMRLANVIQLTDTINTIRLPYLSIADYNLAGMAAIASGWGIASEGVKFVSPTLREKKMSIITDNFCNAIFFDQLPENIICGFNTTAGTCKGDNGGPMTIFYNPTEETLLVGVTSFISSGGCNRDSPSVFTRVQRYLQWISDVSGLELL